MTLTFNNRLSLGWAQAFFSVLVLWGLNNVFMGYATSVLDVNVFIYTAAQFISCSFVLILVGGQGPLVKETLRSIDTWVFGIMILLTYILMLTLLKYVPPTEGALLQRINVFFSLFVGIVFFSRYPTKLNLCGLGLVGFGLYLVCRELPEEHRGIIYLLMFLEGLALTVRVFVAEVHKTHRIAAEQDKDPKARARVVGFVVFIISTLFLVLLGVLAFIKGQTQLDLGLPLPEMADFQNPYSIFAGMFAGVVFFSMLRLLEFSSTMIIKAENYLAVAALAPAATYAWESLLRPYLGLKTPELTTLDIVGGLIMTLGAFVIAFSQIQRQRKSAENIYADYIYYAAQDPQAVQDSRELIANTLEHFNSDIEKSAKALKIDIAIIDAMIADHKKVLGFKADVLKEVARNYRHNVAMADALTGLTNRAGFMTALKQACAEAEVYSLLFIDLNKFKPVNDTYGHDAGDAILKGVAERLTALFPKRALTTRLGGDEFAILLLDSTKEQAKVHVSNIKESLSEAFDFEGTNIEIGASVGISTYPEDGTNPEALLKLADEGMYEEKKDR